jgi:hypothetical protein
MLGTAPMKTGTAAKNRVTPIVAHVGSLLPQPTVLIGRADRAPP